MMSQLISDIKSIKEAGQVKNYIDFIKFPFYRNIDLNTQIDFEFPLTVFIGQNGCGKSSCLHSLYGAPDRYTPYVFWFDTKVDPVAYYDNQKKRHSFWYSYVNEKGETKEVIKARIRRKDDPNYWETSRPLSWAGMRTREDRNERDRPISKNVVYLDFRAELSAFDKFFYFGNLKNSRARNKQEFLRRKSTSLNNLFTGVKTKIYSNSRPLNQPIESFSREELRWISFILGRNYKDGVSVLHELFRNEGFSVLFQTDFAKYSEAVAGSGEMAVVRLVREILKAESYSLVLLDEPEVSLHPGAQERLKLFLLEQIKRRKHQVVLTSHSPSIVRGLPKSAVKVFYQNPNTRRFSVEQNLYPEQAFYHIQFPVSDRKNIIVEDKLAKEIIETILHEMGDSTANLFNVKFNPGGCSVLKKEFMTVFCRHENSQDYVVFDGDQKIVDTHFDWRDLTQAELTLDRLRVEVKSQTNEEINFSVDGGEGGGNEEQKVELLKLYLDYYRSKVFYLPGQIPEDIIWNAGIARRLIQVQLSENKQVDLVMTKLQNSNNKENFRKISSVLYGNDNADSIYATHRLFITSWKNKRDDNFQVIEAIIKTILDNG